MAGVLQGSTLVLNRVRRLATTALAESVAAFLVRDPDPGAWPEAELEATVEHPWAFHQVQALGEELTIVEIGGGDPGLRSWLARAGHRVITVGAPAAATQVGAAIALRADVIRRSGIPDASVDVLVSIRGLEHLPDAEAAAVMESARRMLRPGGHVVLAAGDTDVPALLDAVDAEPVTVERVGRHGFAVLGAAALRTRSAATGCCVVARRRQARVR
jgi:2-polyprenyl-3-methyl-5-hydroxy-6-metoxy-1,4-benzoquinol methylase